MSKTETLNLMDSIQWVLREHTNLSKERLHVNQMWNGKSKHSIEGNGRKITRILKSRSALTMNLPSGENSCRKQLLLQNEIDPIEEKRGNSNDFTRLVMMLQ